MTNSISSLVTTDAAGRARHQMPEGWRLNNLGDGRFTVEPSDYEGDVDYSPVFEGEHARAEACAWARLHDEAGDEHCPLTY